jgi:hypothetical protein
MADIKAAGLTTKETWQTPDDADRCRKALMNIKQAIRVRIYGSPKDRTTFDTILLDLIVEMIDEALAEPTESTSL